MQQLPTTPPSRATEAPQRIDARTLLGTQNAIVIDYNGQSYRLQVTRQGKLILTK